jgi:hypothetical protein
MTGHRRQGLTVWSFLGGGCGNRYLSRDSRLGQRNDHTLAVKVFDGRVDGLVECGDARAGAYSALSRASPASRVAISA